MNWTTIVVVCALSHRGSHAPVEQREALATAFLANVRPHVPLDLLMAVGYAESRWNPTGSAIDRAHGMWGVMQLFDASLVCRDRHGRVNDRACRAGVLEARAHMLDPMTNIRRGATLLEYRWGRYHWGHERNWFATYYAGSLPTQPSPAFDRYAELVRSARTTVRRWLRQCARNP